MAESDNLVDEKIIETVVLEILGEDKEVSWEFDVLVEHIELRVKLTFSSVEKALVRRIVKNMLSIGRIDGKWPEVWAASEVEYPTDTLKKKIAQLEQEIASGPKEQVIVEVPKYIGVQIMRGKKVMKKVEMKFHKEFSTVLDLAEMRMNIFLFGPAGCGKSMLSSQLATALDLPFGFVSCTSGMSEGVIGGKLLPIGKSGTFDYVISEFVKFYEEGGVFLLDEIDAADPNVLLFINAALASDHCPVSNRIAKPYAKKHEDFICVAAANTAGTNADRLYSGRNKLDASTLDRFQVGKILMDYDTELEKLLCSDTELLERCWKIRNSINNHRLERVMSTRFITQAFKMKTEKNWDYEKLDRSFFAGWREDEVNRVKAELGSSDFSGVDSGRGRSRNSSGFSSI